MTRPAAKGKTLWPALVAAVSLLLTAPQAFASRTASTRPELAPSPAREPAPATTAALGPAYASQGFAVRLDADPHPARFALFDDLTPAPERVEPEKLASGVASWEPRPNLQRIQVVVAETWWVREHLGAVDSPNLYQAFGLDPQNNTDPYGLCIFGLPCPETLKSVGGFAVGVGEGLATTAVGVVTAPFAMPFRQFQRGVQGAQRVVEGYQANGLSGAFAAGAAVQDEIAQDSADQLLSMVPGVNTYRLASKVVETYETEGSYAGGRQVGQTTFSLGLDVTTVWAAAKATQAARRSTSGTSPLPEPVDPPNAPEGVVVTREGRLLQLVDDPTVSSADRGWVRSEMRQVATGNRDVLRNPPGKDLRHPAGRPSAQGYDYSETQLQDRATHRGQHRYLVERSTGTAVRIPKKPPKPGPNLPE